MKTVTMSFPEWLAEGERRFGPDKLKWKFVCPACGHVQTVEDFRPYKSQGVTAETAHFNCIGRYAGAKREAFGEGHGPCNYTSGGLFDLRPVVITMTGEKPGKSFAFAEPDPKPEEEVEERTALDQVMAEDPEGLIGVEAGSEVAS